MRTWYTIDQIDRLDSPALVVYPERVNHNIRQAIAMVGDVNRLRPHIKTHKSSKAIKRMLSAGITKFKCATIAEAELLGICKAPDVLLAYQPVGPKLQRFIQLIKTYPDTRFGCLTDNLESAAALSTACEKEGWQIPVYVDINLGMNRTGIQPDENAADLFSSLREMKGVSTMGFHVYDGHHRQPDIMQRTQACDQAFHALETLIEHLSNNGHTIHTVIAGGSPTFPIHARRKNVECSPGTFIYWDKGYGDLCNEQPFLHAAVLLTRIISLPAPDRICTDLGHKSVAAENDIARRVFFPSHPTLKALSQSEEHLVLEAPAGHGLQPGDVLYGIPFHICPTVALYEKVYTVENNLCTGSWKNEARDRAISL